MMVNNEYEWEIELDHITAQLHWVLENLDEIPKRKEKNRKHKINWAAINNPPTMSNEETQAWLKEMGAPTDEEVMRELAQKYAAEPPPDTTKTTPPLIVEDWDNP